MKFPPPAATEGRMCGRGERDARVVLGACALLVLCALARADAPAGKRAESEFNAAMPFVLGTRYGRSEQRHISPRNERFFFGSRYGKRSELRLPPAPQPPLPLSTTPARALICEFTGLFQFYRCSPHNGLDNRRQEDNREPTSASEYE